MAISSWPGNEFIAIASANGEFRARVVIVRLAYSEYVKLIFSAKSKSIIVFALKNKINGMNIVITEFRFSSNNLPWLANMQNTASAKNRISKLLNNPIIFSLVSFLNNNFVICAKTKGITITVKIEYPNCE